MLVHRVRQKLSAPLGTPFKPAETPIFWAFRPDMSRNSPQYPGSLQLGNKWRGTHRRNWWPRHKEWIRPATPRPERRDCHGRLIALLRDLGGEGCSIAAASFRPWCSATFIGAQHRLTLQLDGDAAWTNAQALAARLPEADFSIPGHIVADVAVDAVRETEGGSALIELAVLTVEDW